MLIGGRWRSAVGCCLCCLGPPASVCGSNFGEAVLSEYSSAKGGIPLGEYDWDNTVPLAVDLD